MAIRSWILGFAVLALAVVAAADSGAEEEIEQVNDDHSSFTDFIEKQDFVLVEFYAPRYGAAAELKNCGFTAIYTFGDSLSDTGNSIQEVPQAYQARLTYGMTIHKATGRASDGLLVIDYLAQSAGLAEANEAIEKKEISKYENGANFAVGGVTALPVEALAKKGLNTSLMFTKHSLDVQIGWLDNCLKGTSATNKKDCRAELKTSLFVVWIGFNDYLTGFSQGKTIEDIKKMDLVEDVVTEITNAVKKLIGKGARRVLVPGLFKFGCTPLFLTSFSTPSSTYDKDHCLKDYNDFFAYHNDQLRKAVEALDKANPDVDVVYGDTYKAMQSVQDIGLESPLEACCGVGGKYKFTNDINKFCGGDNVPCCKDPQNHMFFDAVHPTQNTNKKIAQFLIDDVHPMFKCSASKTHFN